jgi:hypothetical protein
VPPGEVEFDLPSSFPRGNISVVTSTIPPTLPLTVTIVTTTPKPQIIVETPPEEDNTPPEVNQPIANTPNCVKRGCNYLNF